MIFLIFVIIPIIEIAIFISIGSNIGILNTIAIILITALVGIFLAAWLFFGTLINFFERTNYLKKLKHLNNQYLGMIVAHLGVAIFIAGVTGSTLWKIEKIRFYPFQEFPTTVAAIYSRGISDIYIAMSEPVNDSWIFRFHYSPLTPWIWIGSIMAFLGGILSFSYRMFKQK